MAAGLALLGSAFIAQAAAAPRGDPEAPRCQGRAATIVGSEEGDVLHGTPRPDVIWGGRGEDVIHGLGGNDVICGGRGEDTIDGGRGNDRIFGGPRDDRLYGGHGDDQILGGGGDDFIHGGLGIDVLRGGRGDDTIDGGYGWDVLDGGRGGDTVSFASAVRSNHEGGGVRVSLRAGRATGDGRDRLRRFENVVGSALDDVLIGKGRRGRLHGGPGEDRCRGVPRAHRISCGRRGRSRAPVEVRFDTDAPDPRAAGIVVVGGGRDDDVSLAFDPDGALLSITAKSGIAVHDGCRRPGGALNEAVCPLGEKPRWLTVDLGPGDDRFRAVGSLRGVGEVRIAGGPGDDVLRGGGEDSLLEGGPGVDRIYGGGGSDALVAGRTGGPDFLFGGPDGNLLASGPPCAGGRIVGGSGADNVSFAELSIQPGVLVASLRRGVAYVRGIRNCRPVRIDRSVENLEGSFGPDVLIGDGRANNLLGQPGADRFYGGGGDDFVDTRDGGRDIHIQCGPRGGGRGLALIDRRDPRPRNCGRVRLGQPIPGLPK